MRVVAGYKETSFFRSLTQMAATIQEILLCVCVRAGAAKARTHVELGPMAIVDVATGPSF